MDQLKYLLSLHSLPGMGARRLKLLVDYFEGFEYAWQQSHRWQEVPGFVGADIEQLSEGKRNCDTELVWDQYLRADARLVTWEDENYPYLLKNIYDPPYLLFYKGRLPGPDDLLIGMVGSRKATAYGRHIAETLAKDLANRGVWVVSGMARGIDTWSHRGCLEAGGNTLAVLGSGIDVIYPRENKDLFTKISQSGAVMSEFPIGAPPLPQHFPARNRIISGLSRGIVVVEAAEKSGSLITVDFALEQGRDVFAVPGPVTGQMSRGTHRLIKQGAKLVEKAGDILEEYIPVETDVKTEFDLFSFTAEERMILEAITAGSVHFDELAVRSGLPASQLASLLTVWELKGLVKQLSGKYYILGKI